MKVIKKYLSTVEVVVQLNSRFKIFQILAVVVQIKVFDKNLSV